MNNSLNDLIPDDLNNLIHSESKRNVVNDVKCSSGWIKIDTVCYNCAIVNETSDVLLKNKCLSNISIDNTFVIIGVVLIIYSLVAMRFLVMDDGDSDVIMVSGI